MWSDLLDSERQRWSLKLFRLNTCPSNIKILLSHASQKISQLQLNHVQGWKILYEMKSTMFHYWILESFIYTQLIPIFSTSKIPPLCLCCHVLKYRMIMVICFLRNRCYIFLSKFLFSKMEFFHSFKFIKHHPIFSSMLFIFLHT